MRILIGLALLRPRTVVAAALALAALGMLAAVLVAPKMTASLADYDDPNSDFSAAMADYTQRTGIDSEQGLQVIVDCTRGSTHPCPELTEIRPALLGVAHIVAVADFDTTGDPRMISNDGDHAYLLVALDRDAGGDTHFLDQVQRAIEAVPGLAQRSIVGGPTVANHDTATISTEDLFIAELVAFPLLVIALLWVFRTAVAAAIPLIGAGFSVLTTFVALLVAQQALQLSTFALNLITALGTGLAIDFSLLIITRYRAERRTSAVPHAVYVAMRSAGRTVAFSGLTVMSALATLCLLPQRFLYSMGIAGVALTGACLIFALVVLPAILLLLGDRIEALSLRRARPADAGRRWRQWSGLVQRHAAVVAVTGTLVLALLAAPALGARIQGYDTDVLPADSAAARVTTMLRNDFDHADTGIAVLVDASSPMTPQRAAELIGALPGILRVQPPVPLSDGSSVINAAVDSPATSPRSREILRSVRGTVPDAQVLGEVARFESLLQSLAHRLPYVALLLIVLSGLFLGVLTRSVVIPIKNAVIGVLSLGATLGILVIVFQHTAIGGSPALEVTALVIVAVLAYGLSTDYASFLFHRMTEARQAGASPRESVDVGLASTAPVVTAAALLLVIPLGALLASQLTPVQMLGAGAALAVVLDATLVRVLLVPSLMGLLGRYNWWPSALHRDDLPAADTKATVSQR
ncbi:MMPL family transporter [Nocardia sp. NPDC058379]|uniref:MMPL family transporter n=1 Tax=unclassified Nocardia TaxID=2637762 RepID=UPI003662A263